MLFRLRPRLDVLRDCVGAWRELYPGHTMALARASLAATLAWELETSLCQPDPVAREPLVTVIIPTYSRPFNIAPLVTSLLGSGHVAEIIISNNHPGRTLADELHAHPRLTIIDQDPRASRGTRSGR